MTPFFHLHFRGGRYDTLRGVPLSELATLAKIEALVRSVARDLFFDGHDERERVSRGFDLAFVPAVTHLEGGGSADCDLGWAPTDDESARYYEAAQTEIVDLLTNLASNREEFPVWLSRESARQMADCLELLQDDELVEFSVDGQDAVAVGPRQREMLRAEAERVRPEVEETYQIVGRVHTLKADPAQAIGLWVRETSRPATVPIAPDLEGASLEAWRRREGTLVRLTGRARRAADRRHLEPAATLEILGGPPVGSRLAELLEIPDGWLDPEEGESHRLSRGFARQVERDAWGFVERVGLDRPYLFLTPSGGVESMWRDDGRCRTTIDHLPDGRVQGLHVDLERNQVERLPEQPLGPAVDTWLAQRAKVTG